MHFHLIMTAGEIGAFLAVPFHPFINKITVQVFDALIENLDTYSNNKFCAKCRSGA